MREKISDYISYIMIGIIGITIMVPLILIAITFGFGILTIAYSVLKDIFNIVLVLFTYPLMLIAGFLPQHTINIIYKYRALSIIAYFILVLISFKINKGIPLFLYVGFPFVYFVWHIIFSVL